MIAKEAVLEKEIDVIIDTVQSFFDERQETFGVASRESLRRCLENIVKNIKAFNQSDISSVDNISYAMICAVAIFLGVYLGGMAVNAGALFFEYIADIAVMYANINPAFFLVSENVPIIIEWITGSWIFHTVMTKSLRLYHKFSSAEVHQLRKIGAAVTEIDKKVIFTNADLNYLINGERICDEKVVKPEYIIEALKIANDKFAKELNSKHQAHFNFNFFNTISSMTIGKFVGSFSGQNHIKQLLTTIGGASFSCFFKKIGSEPSPKDPGQHFNGFFQAEYVGRKQQDFPLGKGLYGGNTVQDDALSPSPPTIQNHRPDRLGELSGSP